MADKNLNGSDYLPFLLEIGTEEIPSDFLTGGLNSLQISFLKQAGNARLDTQDVAVMGTPRRLILTARIAPKQSDLTTEVTGPPKRVAYDGAGNPTKAALGFAKNLGLSVENLRVVETPKGEYLAATVEEKGKPAAEVLGGLLSSCIVSIPWRKSMRWADLDVTFARPIHWIVALLDKEVIPLTFGTISSDRVTRGHRFVSPEPVALDSPQDFIETLQSLHVLAHQADRRVRIEAELEHLAKEAGGRPVQDAQVLDGNVNLTEWPLCVLGSFSEDFLKMPREVLITSMRSHQRYFSLENPKDGSLLPLFIAVNNTPVSNPDLVRAGHERVLRARLTDAAFFWHEDLKHPLSSRREALGKVTFLAKLKQPSLIDKVNRIEAIVKELARALVPQEEGHAVQAAQLCKCDLVTLMVGEFPDLQGTMGRYYAQEEEVPPAVAKAIEGHYRPRGASDSPPDDHPSALLGMADRLDTITACFSIGLLPTGTADPYALRRAALGILRTICDRGYQVSLRWMCQTAAQQMDVPAIAEQVLSFILGRLRVLVGESADLDVVDAVIATGESNPINIKAKVEALVSLKGTPDFEPLAIGVKRAGNITKGTKTGTVDPSLFVDDEERTLADALGRAQNQVSEALDRGDYNQALEVLAALRTPIDNFFDTVLVMAEEPRLRANRLALCGEVAGLFGRIADFSLIRT